MEERARACGVRVEPKDPPNRSDMRRHSRTGFAPARVLVLVMVIGGFVTWGLVANAQQDHHARRGKTVSARAGQLDPVVSPSRAALPPRESLRAGAVLGEIAWRPSKATIALPFGDATPSSVSSSPARVPADDTEVGELPPLEIRDVRVDALQSSSATLSWRTSEPVVSRIGYGLDATTLWTPSSMSIEHTATLDGLLPATTYRLWIMAHAEDGRAVEVESVMATPARSGPVEAKTVGDKIVVADQALFPTLVWGQCADSYASSIAAGINVFMENPCESLSEQTARLHGHGFVVANAAESQIAGANVIGSFLPDEWDTFLPGDLTVELAERLVPPGARSPLFLTLTNHFYSGAAPLPQGRGAYAALVHTADVLGFDLYPLQNWCRTDALGAVYDAQRELVELAAGKPTFQWIEARDMDCSDPALTVTPQTLRAETWLAIAGGAHGIGYFPHSWNVEVGDEISRERRELDALGPALLEPAIAATTTSPQVKVGARERNGAVYVIVVNGSFAAASATITVPKLADRSFVSLDGLRRSIAGSEGAFTDLLDSLDVHIYIAAPTP